ncbi:MAG: M20/M25/M40 family metallo-hydrolase [Candidatus Bathyarchaeia archaeon]
MPTQNLRTDAEEETTRLLSQLIRIDTTNPPGNETQAAGLLAEELGREGIGYDIYESTPQRGSIIARLKGTGEKPRVLLLSHLDVVPAQAAEWAVNPFSGAVKDGFVWGRGALDMKGMTAIEVMTLKLLKREGVKLKGDVILAATADEEMGGLGGADYLLRAHPEKIFAEYVLNEGGGSAIPLSGRNLFTVSSAEKGLLWFRVRARGVSGHGSMPETADNAVLRMNRVVERLGNYRRKPVLVPAMRQFLNEVAAAEAGVREPVARMLADPEASDKVLEELEGSAVVVADEVRPRIRMSITPTMIRGGVKENVIPSECEAVFDCRVLPGQTTSEAMALVRELLRDVGLERLSFETIQVQEASESSVDTPLFRAIEDSLRLFEPNCGVAPILMAGGTDSRFFRRMGSVCYGFHPMRSETQLGAKLTRREHGVDERISVENLVFGVSVLYEAVKRLVT